MLHFVATVCVPHVRGLLFNPLAPEVSFKF
jgi:hypothetical protein